MRILSPGLRAHRGVVVGIGVVCVYGVLALAANWPAWPGDPNLLRNNIDIHQQVWFLSWLPFAVAHGHNVFYTTALNYPSGINLADNASMPLLALLVAPLTVVVGPIASLNLLLWLAFPLSASSMFFVLRRFVAHDGAAFFGGAIYGFSPYVVSQSFDHLLLAFVPLPPLILLSLYETLRDDQAHSVRWGVTLGLMLTAQFFISEEIAATTALVAVLAVLVLCGASPRAASRIARQGASGVIWGALVFIVCIAYPVWVMLDGPYHYNGSASGGRLSADLLGTVMPTSMQHFGLLFGLTTGNGLLGGNVPENGSYLGVPMLALMAFLVLWNWRRPWIRFAAVMVIIVTVLSLGPHLIVDNRVTTVPLPFDLIWGLLFANSILPSRFALFAALFAALLVAVGTDSLCSEAASRLRRRAEEGSLRTGSWARSAARWLLGILAVLAAISLVPRWPFPTASAAVPAFVTDATMAHVPIGTVALFSPYPSVVFEQPQLWQAVADMRFSIIGGYGNFDGPNGSVSYLPSVLEPEQVQRFLWAQASLAPYPIAGSEPPGITPDFVCSFESFLRRQHVGMVVSTPLASQQWVMNTLFADALGAPSARDGAFEIWYGVQGKLARRTRMCSSG